MRDEPSRAAPDDAAKFVRVLGVNYCYLCLFNMSPSALDLSGGAIARGERVHARTTSATAKITSQPPVRIAVDALLVTSFDSHQMARPQSTGTTETARRVPATPCRATVNGIENANPMSFHEKANPRMSS